MNPSADDTTAALPASPSGARWTPHSIAAIVAAWFALQIGGLFTPGLLDDVDSIYIQIAREMLQRHDFVTPTINGIRFFDKPPLMYWMAAGSMRLFGIHDWAARLPLALGTLGLLLSVYALANRLFATNPEAAQLDSKICVSANPDRAGLYAALALATSIGPYLYTRFYIPDILIALWMTLSVHLFLTALNRLTTISVGPPTTSGGPSFASFAKGGVSSEARPLSSTSALPPMLAFGAVMALNVLTKGLIGLVFPIAFVLLYLAITRQLRLLAKLHLPAATAVFALLAAPWHILAALRNPAIAMPANLGLPAKAGWAWFYLYNEHIARFLQKRIPHDYGQTPVWLFWLFAVLWMMPWAAFLPSALRLVLPRSLSALRGSQTALTLLLWPAIVLGFFTLSARQEYYSLPALPALALLLGGALAEADRHPAGATARGILRGSLWLLVPLTTTIAAVCAYFAITAPRPAPGADLVSLLTNNPELYNLSLGHLYDLTGRAMGLFRAPLAFVALSMFVIGPVVWWLRRSGRAVAANLTLAAAMVVTLLCVHEGLRRFYPILGSKELALTIDAARQPGDLIILDGELTSGSSIIFYTGQQVHLVDGRVNGIWFGSFWPDASAVFETESTLRQRWQSPQRIFLLTYNPECRTRTNPKCPTRDLTPFAPVITLASSGGKTILTNKHSDK